MINDFVNDIEECLKALHEGEVILYPTDTIWGLGCDATNASAVQKLINLKGKDEGKGLIVLLASEREVLHYAASPDLAVFDYLASTAKPTTVIYSGGLNVASQVLNNNGSIAIRLVKDEFCSHLLKRFKKPIVSTSANLHGQPSPQNFSQVLPQLKSAVKYVVKFRQQDEYLSTASSIIAWTNGEVQVIRP